MCLIIIIILFLKNQTYILKFYLKFQYPKFSICAFTVCAKITSKFIYIYIYNFNSVINIPYSSYNIILKKSSATHKFLPFKIPIATNFPILLLAIIRAWLASKGLNPRITYNLMFLKERSKELISASTFFSNETNNRHRDASRVLHVKLCSRNGRLEKLARLFGRGSNFSPMAGVGAGAKNHASDKRRPRYQRNYLPTTLHGYGSGSP